MPHPDSYDDPTVVVTAASRALRRQLRPLVWVALEEVALEAVVEGGRLVARTSARQVADRLGVDPGTAANALRDLRRQGLLTCDREHGPAGRFGLSLYVLGSVSGLTVLAPRVARPDLAGPAPDEGAPRPVEPGADEPHMVQAHKVNPESKSPARPATAHPQTMDTVSVPASPTTPQCPGQTTFDLGPVSS